MDFNNSNNLPSLDWCIKLGGSLFKTSIALEILDTIYETVKSGITIIVTTGSGPFGDHVRDWRNIHGITTKQYESLRNKIVNQELLSNFIPSIHHGYARVTKFHEIWNTLKSGYVPVFSPSEWFNVSYPFPHAGPVDSEVRTLALAYQLRASRILIATNVDGIYIQAPSDNIQLEPIPELLTSELNTLESSPLDRHFGCWMEYFYIPEVYVANGYNISNIKKLLKGMGTFRGTKIVTERQRTSVRLFSGMKNYQEQLSIMKKKVSLIFGIKEAESIEFMPIDEGWNHYATVGRIFLPSHITPSTLFGKLYHRNLSVPLLPFEIFPEQRYLIESEISHCLNGLDTPRIYWKGRGVVIMEDLGDQTAAKEMKDADNTKRYDLIIELVHTLQRIHQRLRGISLNIYSETPVDKSRLSYCFEAWYEFLKWQKNDNLLEPSYSASLVKKIVEDACRELKMQTILWDCNLTNFIKKCGQFKLLDFEEATVGWVVQDLCSLLRNSSIGAYGTSIAETGLKAYFECDQTYGSLGWENFVHAWKAASLVYHVCQTSYGMYFESKRFLPKRQTFGRPVGSGLLYHLNSLHELCKQLVPKMVPTVYRAIIDAERILGAAKSRE